jgi:homoserine O-acetyltransferase
MSDGTSLARPEPNLPPPPASGGWEPSDPVGHRRFIQICSSRPFALEFGGALSDITLAYETWGELNASATNAVLVCHALTGDSHAAGALGRGHPTDGWWNDMIGPGRPLDTDRYFVVCANVLGGCQGSTGPMSIAPDGKRYGSRFPMISVRDIVRSQAMLADHLGITTWMTVVGGSMGGMQALEWATMYPRRVSSLVSVASAAQASAQQIAWSYMGRLAIANDPNWNNGDYYEAPPGEGPHEGLMLARRIAQIHYRSDASLEQRFSRATRDDLHGFAPWNRFQVESYLDHHGRKLAHRFDANSYMVLNRTMDMHDIGRDRGGLDAAFARITCPTLVVSIDSDDLYTPRQQATLRDGLLANGTPVVFEVLHSIHGHDGFLIEFDQLGPIVDSFVSDHFKTR